MSALRPQDGQAMVEYAVILVLVSVVVVIVLLTLGGELTNLFSNVAAGLGASPPPAPGNPVAPGCGGAPGGGGNCGHGG